MSLDTTTFFKRWTKTFVLLHRNFFASTTRPCAVGEGQCFGFFSKQVLCSLPLRMSLRSILRWFCAVGELGPDSVWWGYAPHTRGYFPFTRKVTKVVSKGTPLRHPRGYAPQWSIDHAPPLPHQRVQPEAIDLRESEAFRFELNRQRELRAGSACKEKRWCSE